ncbi:Stk1 family PASTA domain-containing Ser/Thr kinase [Paenalkalicoccus suaedae]|uniref:Serine/threonine-protein kinase PrkC n=1 Tax=Paenalkalicoccus suaedae TaxID=2592382 RepID=A0A859FFM2_9BACI|nr:Stk1 family PASTA domain-containing Ser/Thr kinase [Paenalkalicoccus suaedae]QKS71482.1 Stk1 family PASTA domain-containing Ser/Thr kinase [Paenalkalicoccus suaedae]
MIGKRLNDRYKLIRPIGGGGMADVYLAKDLILDRHVAVKMLKTQFSNDDEFIQRFRREAEAATSLSHPNVVSIYDVGEEEDLYYIVMEYVEGETLKDYVVANGSLSVDESIRILKQIASALSHAHANHIVHRDIKPQNILIGVDGIAKVTDFGIARAINEATITHTNSVLGSVHYLSPEQARGGQVTFKSDLYSLGIIGFEMLTGEAPFKGDTAVSVAIKHIQEPIPSVTEKAPHVPQSVDNMIMKLTAKDVTNRYESADELQRELATILDPSRVNEAPIEREDDPEATKAIPVIPADAPLEGDPTLVRKPDEAPAQGPAAEPAKKKKKRVGKWIGLSALFLALLLFLVFFLIPRLLYVNDVTIPEGLVGQPSSEVVAELETLGLEVELTYREDDTVEPDHVISTNPQGGNNVKEGSLVTVFANEANGTVDMNDVVGLSLEEAEELLADFEDIEVVYEESATEDEGTVLSQSPEANEPVIAEETVVTLTVSEGMTYVMDNLFGMTRSEVLDQMDDNPYVTLRFEEDFHPSIESGLVIAQSPSRGTEINAPVTVEVTFSRGPEPSSSGGSSEIETPEPDPEPEPEPDPGEEDGPVTSDVPFSVEVPPAPEGSEPPEYRIQISIIDSESDTPREVVSESITETTRFTLPMTLNPGDTGYLLLYVNGQEFSESPYEYTYEELLSYQ